MRKKRSRENWIGITQRVSFMNASIACDKIYVQLSIGHQRNRYVSIVQFVFGLYCTKEYRWFIMNHLCLCVQIHEFCLSHHNQYMLSVKNLNFTLSPSLSAQNYHWKSIPNIVFLAIDILTFLFRSTFSEKIMPRQILFFISRSHESKQN